MTIIEPGAFRTDWGGSSMQIADVGPDYEETVGRIHAYRRDADGKQPGDPVRAAKVIVDVVALAEPPLRLLLGSDAYHFAQQASVSRADEADTWAAVSRSTDFDNTTDISRTPIAELLAR